MTEPPPDSEATIVYAQPPPKLARRTDAPTKTKDTRVSRTPYPGVSPELLLSRFRAILTAFAVAGGLLTLDAVVWDDHVWLRSILWSPLVVALIGSHLIRRPTLTLLHRLEVAGIGAIDALFVSVITGFTLRAAWDGDADQVNEIVEHGFAYWIMGALAYATLIPAPPRRTVGIVAGCAVLPVLLALSLAALSPAVRVALDPQRLAADTFATWAVAFIAGYASSVINELRREVREARKLGQYQLREKLGEGGMGEVYRAEHAMLKRPCAIKLIRSDVLADQSVRDRFEREVQSTAMLTHPNTVEVFDYGRTDDGTFYYVMELLPGMTLQDLVEKHGPMSAPRVVHLLRQVCGALAEAHSEGLIHRDVKPANIFSSHRGGVWDTAKLLDFGLVKGQQNKAPDSLAATREGTVAGSPLYMAPEQAKGTEPDPRSDLYSLGGVGYFLLTGQAPFDGETPMEVIIAHARDQVVPISEINPDVPEDLEAVVMRCLEKRPDDRYASAEDLELALAEVRCEEWTRRMAREWWDNAPSEREEEPELARA